MNVCTTIKNCRRSLFFVATLSLNLMMFAGAAVASPSVSGNTISWPDDGWYQVQRADNFETVCEGGRECSVGAGEYIVINHSSGERFNNIVIGGSGVAGAAGDSSGSIDLPAGISVDGNQISWPDDGWYQVQSASDFSSVCEGGRSCVVPAGEYIVINHSRSMRFENIVVGGSSSSATPASTGSGSDQPQGISVTGNVISWPDDGWYQVQNALSQESICEGGRSCTVEPGLYQVINHSTGTRFDIVDIGRAAVPVAPSIGTSPGAPTGDVLAQLDAVLPRTFRTLNGLDFEFAEALASELLDALAADTGAAPAGLTIVSDVGGTRRFNCAGAGTLEFDRLTGGGRARASNCAFGDWVFEGEFARFTEPGVDIFDAAALVMSSSERTINFTADSFFSSNEDGSALRRGWFVDEYQETSRSGVVQSQTATLTMERTGTGSSAITTLSGSGAVFDGPINRNRLVGFGYGFDVRADEGFFFPRGQVSLSVPSTAVDGLEPVLFLRAGNGDNSTYTLESMNILSGNTEALATRPWNETVGLRCDVAIRGGRLSNGCL